MAHLHLPNRCSLHCAPGMTFRVRFRRSVVSSRDVNSRCDVTQLREADERNGEDSLRCVTVFYRSARGFRVETSIKDERERERRREGTREERGSRESSVREYFGRRIIRERRVFPSLFLFLRVSPSIATHPPNRLGSFALCVPSNLPTSDHDHPCAQIR